MISKSAIAVLGGVITLSAVTAASAGPMPTTIAAIKQAATIQPTEVRWNGGGIAAGVGLGLLGAALLAPQAYGYYGPSYSYGPAYYPAYYPSYYPAYYARPAYYYGHPRYYGWRHHWRHHRRW